MQQAITRRHLWGLDLWEAVLAQKSLLPVVHLLDQEFQEIFLVFLEIRRQGPLCLALLEKQMLQTQGKVLDICSKNMQICSENMMIYTHCAHSFAIKYCLKLDTSASYRSWHTKAPDRFALEENAANSTIM